MTKRSCGYVRGNGVRFGIYLLKFYPGKNDRVNRKYSRPGDLVFIKKNWPTGCMKIPSGVGYPWPLPVRLHSPKTVQSLAADPWNNPAYEDFVMKTHTIHAATCTQN